MSSQRRKCFTSPDQFCYVCGSLTLKKQSLNITALVKEQYLECFGIPLGDQDKKWAPHKICTTCRANLLNNKSGKRKRMPFVIPMIWREPTNHATDCYFCMVDTNGRNALNKSTIQYPNVPSAIRPVINIENFQVHVPCTSTKHDDDSFSHVSSNTMENEKMDETFKEHTFVPKFCQGELNDLVRDLNLSKNLSELLASRLAEKTMLMPDVKITFYRKRETSLLKYFSKQDDFVYCNDIASLINKIGIISYSPEQWRLFIDSSKRSLKCVLLHNGNKFNSIPIAHSYKAKETYESVKRVLQLISYDVHKWEVCVDLKMVCILLGQQHGYTKHPCFHCLWDSRSKDRHWNTRDWPSRTQLDIGEHNIVRPALLERNKIIFPPLHIKLGLMKQFVRALNKEGDCFKYISQSFPGISSEKLKAGILDGSQIRKLIKDTNFAQCMDEVEASAWHSFVELTKKFLGNYKDECYQDIIQNCLDSFHSLGCNMSVKVHFLFSHLDKFPDNLGDVSDEHGERFHQDIKIMEERYQGTWGETMMADYCWTLKRDCVNVCHRRKAKKRKLYP